jgi:hypothetical protein
MHEFEPRPPAAAQEPFAYYFPDTVLDGWSSDAFTVRLASVRGASHRYRGQPRQDHVETFCMPYGEAAGEAVVFAVADGVSNCAHGELGSLFAVRGAIHSLRQQTAAARLPDWAAVLNTAVRFMQNGAETFLRVPNPGLRELADLMATTLVCGVVWSSPRGICAAVARAGDSGAWALGGQDYRPLFAPKRGADDAVLPSGVAALPRIPARIPEARFELMPHEALLVGTDGFGDPLGDGTGEIGQLFARWLATPPPPRGFAHLLDFSRDNFDDDRALLAIWPRARRDEAGT